MTTVRKTISIMDPSVPLQVRVGLPLEYKYGLEKLFYNYGLLLLCTCQSCLRTHYDVGVDMALWGHEHIYERLWPVYNREVRLFLHLARTVCTSYISLLLQVMNGSYDTPYKNPRAPVHIITGSAVSFSTVE